MPGPRRVALVLAPLAGVLGVLAAVPAATTAVAATRPPGIRVSAVGDTILGDTPSLPAHPRRWFADVRWPLAHGGDLVFANLEGTLTDETRNKCGGSSGGTCFAFRNPPRYGRVFADVGFTVLGTANNHSHDYFSAGFADTQAAIAGAGLDHTGAPGEIAYARANGVRTATLAFAPYRDTANLLDIPGAEDLVRRAHRHADVVIVYMHAGAEGSGAQHVTGHEEYAFGEDRGNPRRFARHMVRAGADLVIGSGPHVLRGMEFYRGHLIAYSLGNFANYHNFNASGVLADSAILRVSLGPHGRYRSGRLVPVVLDAAGHPTRGGPARRIVRRLSRDDFGTHAARITRDGHIRPPA